MYLFLFLVRASPAQPPYRFFPWTTENGLPQNSIQALLQTRDGYLWMSTLDGLVRFDGFHFRIFNRQNTPALTTDGFSFFTLLEDRRGLFSFPTMMTPPCVKAHVVQAHAGMCSKTTYSK
jgi:ligand-binding sensor domain-containing protein